MQSKSDGVVCLWVLKHEKKETDTYTNGLCQFSIMQILSRDSICSENKTTGNTCELLNRTGLG